MGPLREGSPQSGRRWKSQIFPPIETACDGHYLKVKYEGLEDSFEQKTKQKKQNKEGARAASQIYMGQKQNKLYPVTEN